MNFSKPPPIATPTVSHPGAETVQTTREGIIVGWENDKGFGWVESGGKRLFAHIRDFDRLQRRPAKGDQVVFVEGVDRKNRRCAKNIALLKPGPKVGFFSWVLLLLLLVLPLLALLLLPVPWWHGASALLMVSIFTYHTYSHDKRQAENSGHRVSEKFLHFAELLGGWPGAFVAQRRFRHKCSKPSYQFVFWGIVFLFQVVSLDVVLDHRMIQSVFPSTASRTYEHSVYRPPSAGIPAQPEPEHPTDP